MRRLALIPLLLPLPALAGLDEVATDHALPRYEALAHSTAPWTNEDNPRVSIFNLYNSVGSRWSAWNPPDELLQEMPPMRQTLFRGTHCADNLPGYRYGGQNQKDRRPLDE